MDRRLAPLLALLLVSGIALSAAAYVFGGFPFNLEVAAWLRGVSSGTGGFPPSWLEQSRPSAP